MPTSQYPKININEPSIKREIAKVVYDVLSDPDFGLDLKSSFIKKLQTRQKSKAKGVPLEKVLSRYQMS